MADWSNYLTDVNGAFLMGDFEDDDEEIYMEIPKDFKKKYALDKVLRLLKTIYGLKKAARMFWKLLLKAMRVMKFEMSKVDPCLYWKRTENGLVIWLSWIDDYLCVGPTVEVRKAREEMLSLFECDDVGEVKEYLGCKVERNQEKGEVRLTQPVILQSFEDEFDLPQGNKMVSTPAIAGTVSNPDVIEVNLIGPSAHGKYRTGVGKLLHVTRWSRPEIWNAVRELTRAVKGPSQNHYAAMERVMKYYVDTPEDAGNSSSTGNGMGNRI